MSVDPAVLKAMAEAVDRDPESVSLRIHLAELLLESGAEVEALDHFAAALGREPGNRRALEGAAKAAAAVGDVLRADGYRRLLDSLTAESAPAPTDERPQGPADRERAALTATGDPGPGDEASGWWEVEWPRLTLSDVGGMDDVKRRLNVAFLGPLQNPDVMRMYGKSLRGGLLLYGPPGCGKTFIARAVAGEMGAKFIAVGLDDVLSMWLGESERQLHEIFESARRNAPCILFFDELDAIGQRRNQRAGAGRTVVNQLLAELDGVDSANEGVFVLAATNHPWDVDPGLLRPGRFDRMMAVFPPDEAARVAILAHHLKGKPQRDLDLKRIAARTDLFSGADLAHLCTTATEFVIEESLARGIVRAIDNSDLDRALKEIRPSSRPWFETARNFALFANDGGTYDELVRYMRTRKLM